MTFPAAALGEVYFTDTGVEISGNGTRPSRSCMILLRPTETLGDDQAPRLIITTSGQSRLSVGVDRPDQYQIAMIARDNARRPFVNANNLTLDQFRQSEIWKALTAQRPFFVTARRAGTGKYVSSRYEKIDFDAILGQVEIHCPFDADSLMSDSSARERSEQALAISQADLVLIRWALHKKYGVSSSEPEPRATLSGAERDYLKRYAGDNDLPLSRYLSAVTARRLRAEGAVIAAVARTPPPPPPPVFSDYFTFNLCNNTSRKIVFAVSYHVSPVDRQFMVKGWGSVEKRECKDLTFPKGWFYFYGEQQGTRKFWGGTDSTLCVTYPGPFERVNTAGVQCEASRLKGFRSKYIPPSQDKYSLSLDD